MASAVGVGLPVWRVGPRAPRWGPVPRPWVDAVVSMGGRNPRARRARGRCALCQAMRDASPVPNGRGEVGGRRAASGTSVANAAGTPTAAVGRHRRRGPASRRGRSTEPAGHPRLGQPPAPPPRPPTAEWGRAPRPRPAGARGPSSQLPPTRAKGGGGGRGAAVCQGARSRLPSETPPAATGRAGLRHPLPLTGGRQRCVAGGGRLPVVRGGRRPPERAGRPPTAVPALVHGGIPALGSFQGRSPLGGHARPQESPSGDAGWTTAPT